MRDKPRVDIDATAARLARLGLEHAAERLPERLAQAISGESALHALSLSRKK